MTPAEKALWFIESHLAGEFTLAEVAAAGGVSRHHLVRAFGAATGRSVMRYVRARRLSEAARQLADGGARDILSVALDAGYGSHEAFTRAFRQQFGTTPEVIRGAGTLDTSSLLEPIAMNANAVANLAPPRFETGRRLLVAGLRQRYSGSSTAGIPAQWQRFQPHLGHIRGQIGHVAYGVCCNADDEGNMDYIAGVEVEGFADLPDELTGLRIAARRYAVFAHQDHISSIRGTWHAIWNGWLPGSGLKAADAPDFERYDEAFDPRTGLGGFEIWVPVEG